MKKIKSFFESPKKAIISTICIIPLLVILGAGIAFIVSVIVKNTSIGPQGARDYAFADAGIQPAAAQAVYTEFEFEDGHFVYEVSFIADNTKYEYVIKAADGTILKREPDISSYMTSYDMTSDTASGAVSYIDAENAKEIAVSHAGLSVPEVTFLKAMLENEGLYMVYEIEFRKNQTEYDYEIHAETGEILKYDVELMD